MYAKTDFAALRELAAAVAREVNNPLAAMRSAITLIKGSLEPSHEHYELQAIFHEVTVASLPMMDVLEIIWRISAIDTNFFVTGVRSFLASRSVSQSSP